MQLSFCFRHRLCLSRTPSAISEIVHFLLVFMPPFHHRSTAFAVTYLTHVYLIIHLSTAFVAICKSIYLPVGLICHVHFTSNHFAFLKSLFRQSKNDISSVCSLISAPRLSCAPNIPSQCRTFYCFQSSLPTMLSIAHMTSISVRHTLFNWHLWYLRC